MKRPFMEKLESGEFIGLWRGYSPFYAGCFYGSSLVLGGEKKFEHCHDWFSGIGDVDWWIVEELNKHTEEELNELEAILKRNKEFYEYKSKVAGKIAEVLNVEPFQIHRLSSLEFKGILDLIDSKK